MKEVGKFQFYYDLRHYSIIIHKNTGLAGLGSNENPNNFRLIFPLSIV